MLKADGPWDLVLLGDGPLKADLCRLVSDLACSGSVLLPGFMQDPWTCLRITGWRRLSSTRARPSNGGWW